MKKQKIFGILLLILIGGLSYIFFNFFGDTNTRIKHEKTGPYEWIDQSLVGLHNGENIEDILNEENYKKVGIDPTKYETFGDFLEELKDLEGIDIDPINENFSIGIENENGDILYIPFKYQKNKSVFDDAQNKNLAILDIYSSYKEGMIFGGINSKSGHKVIFENERRYPKTSEIVKVFNFEENVFDYIRDLEKPEILGKDNEELLAYFYEFTGDYDNANNLRDKICKEYGCDDNTVEFTLFGKVIDEDGDLVANADIELINNPKYKTKSNDKGEYSFTFPIYSLSHLRFKTSIDGWSNGFANYQLNELGIKTKKIEIDFNLHKAHDTLVMDEQKLQEYENGKYWVFETEGSKYFVPRDGLYYFDGRKYEGSDFNIYFYQFTKWTNMENLLENDTFEPVMGFVGSIMKTFGMPLVQFTDRKTGEELFILASNPMILQNQVYHMQELYDNFDQIYDAITREDMEFLYQFSLDNDGYPIDFDFQTQNDFLRWPTRWSLDRKKGIWENVGHRLLDTDGLVELPFYSFNDEK